MARRFLYVSIGILALSLAHHFGVTGTTAQVGAGAGPILGASLSRAWDHFGQAWQTGGTWTRRPEWDLPVSADDVLFIDGNAAGAGGSATLATTTGTVWEFNGSIGVWSYEGQWPGGPTSAENQSFGKTKGLYRGQ
jgi:hypothetical protein